MTAKISYKTRTFLSSDGEQITYKQLYVNDIPVKVSAGKASSTLARILVELIDSEDSQPSMKGGE